MRVVRDAMGTVSLPDEALYGSQTARTVDNMSFSGVTLAQFPEYIRTLVQVKLACARANGQAGHIREAEVEQMEAACKALLEGQYADQFPVDMFHGGGGIGVNMNINEVLAGLAGEGIDPGDHVNLSQSTADVCHTSLRLAIHALGEVLVSELREMHVVLAELAVRFNPVQTIARTCWQDGLRVSASSLFEGQCAAVQRHIIVLKSSLDALLRVNLGGTVIGSGVGASTKYRSVVLAELARVTGLPVVARDSLFDAAQNPDDLTRVSSEVRSVAGLLRKFAQDLRLLSSGPETGLGEIKLPVVQAGSSFFPGKVNPVIPEMVIQCSLLVTGNHCAVQEFADLGEVHLNVWESAIGVLVMQNLRMLTNALALFRDKCVRGVELVRDTCESYAHSVIPGVVDLKERYGYKTVATWVSGMAPAQLKQKIEEEFPR